MRANLQLKYSQQQVVRTEPVVGKAGVDKEENEDEEHQCIFGINEFVYIYHSFLVYRLLHGNEYIGDRGIMQHACLYAYEVIVLACLEQT